MRRDLATHAVADLIEQGRLEVGDGYRAKNSELSDDGIPFARAGNISDGFAFDGADRLPFRSLDRVGSKISRPGDVVFTSKGTVGRFALVAPRTPRFVYSPQLCYWRSKDAEFLDPGYLYYWMNSREFYLQFKGVSGQTDMAEYVSLRDQRRMRVTIPPIAEQHRIARILGTLDDKIELNRRMNETLEETARAVFKSWFVDFDPVRAKAVGRDPGIPPHLADLFPARLVDSELGEIPEGWEVRPLGDLLELLETGGRPKGGVARYASGVPSIGAESIAGLGIHDFSKTKYVPREYFDAMKRGHVEDADVLLYKDGGKPGQFEPHVTLVGGGFPFAVCAINEHVYRVRVDSALGQIYLYYWLSSEIAGAEMRNRGTGVAIPGLNSTQVKSLPTLVPTQPVAAHFGHACGPLVSRIFANCNQSRALTATRDALLPRLISGEISSSAIGRREAASTPSGP